VRPLLREDGSVICSAVCQWSESRRTQNHTLLSHLRLIRFPSRRLLRLAGITAEVCTPASTRGTEFVTSYSLLSHVLKVVILIYEPRLCTFPVAFKVVF
jgi:hypothetical protein